MQQQKGQELLGILYKYAQMQKSKINKRDWSNNKSQITRDL